MFNWYFMKSRYPAILKNAFFLLSLLCISCQGFSQPSGGPYGPVNKTYEIPTGAVNVYYVSPDGKADNGGKDLANTTTLEEAVKRVVTNDVIILRGGTYRTGNLLLNQGITMQPYKDENPVIKGTYIAENWRNMHNGLWVTEWEYLFPSAPADWWHYEHNIKQTPLYRFNNDMVFIDGKFLQATGMESMVDENTFFIDYDKKKVYIGVDPTEKLIEITAFDNALVRTTGECHEKKTDGIGPKIKGVTFTQYAYRALEIEGTEPEGISAEKDHGKDVTGSLFENCTISFCSRVAGYFRGDNMVFRNCKISDTSTEGLYIIASNDVLLERNIIARNNIENITGYFPAAVKIFNQCYRTTCNDNLVIDHPNSNGIWYDVGNVDGVFINNWVENVGSYNHEFPTRSFWPSNNGFFFEISKGVTCAGNVFVNCDRGLMILNSSNAKIYQNTFFNSIAAIGRDGRSAQGDHFGWHPSTGPDVEERVGHVFVNNLLVGDENFNRPLFFVWQPDFICERLPGSPMEKLDNNVFFKSENAPASPLIIWSPVAGDECQLFADDVSDLQKFYTDYNAKGASEFDVFLPFKSTELSNFKLTDPAKYSGHASVLPVNVAKILNLSRKAKPYIGAYYEN